MSFNNNITKNEGGLDNALWLMKHIGRQIRHAYMDGKRQDVSQDI